MNKQQGGMIKTAIPVIVIAIGGLVGWGGHQQQIKINTGEIDKKVDIAVYESDRNANDQQHNQILKNQEIMQADIKELLKKK